MKLQYIETLVSLESLKSHFPFWWHLPCSMQPKLHIAEVFQRNRNAQTMGAFLLRALLRPLAQTHICHQINMLSIRHSLLFSSSGWEITLFSSVLYLVNQRSETCENICSTALSMLRFPIVVATLLVNCFLNPIFAEWHKLWHLFMLALSKILV